MHYCVVFFYPRAWSTPFGHVDLMVLNSEGKFRFTFNHRKLPFSFVELKVGKEIMELPEKCTEALVIKVERETGKFSVLNYLFKTCSELTRLCGQLDVGMSITPQSLYKKLIKFDTKRNFTIIQRVKR